MGQSSPGPLLDTEVVTAALLFVLRSSAIALAGSTTIVFGAADEVEGVANDRGLGEHAPHGLPVRCSSWPRDP